MDKPFECFKVLDVWLSIIRDTIIRDTGFLSYTIRGSSAWFKVLVLAAHLAGTVPHRSRRRGPDSGETRKTLYRELKRF